jgi:histidinol-phosphate/aromatic aminotransferase/cobyric acid decarboxylase-like protein
MRRVHGGPDPRELETLGLGPDELLDFSVNVNPYGAAPEVLAAVRAARLDRYPDPAGGEARLALARRWDVPPDRVALGNGAAELLWTAVQLLCPAGRTLLVVEPTFCEPALAAEAIGARVSRLTTTLDSGFSVDPLAVAAAVRADGASAVYLCNPQNPTGRVLPARTISELGRALAPVTLILDEAFLSVSTRAADLSAPMPENVLRVRSFTKEHGLPGLRLGALLGPAPLVARLESSRPAWTVSAPAQAAIAACAEVEAAGFVAGVRERWLADTAALAEELRAEAGLSPLPTDTVYLLCPVGDASEVRRRLLVEHRVLVRDAASFGLPALIRLGGRPAPDRRRLIAALARIRAATT